MESQNISRKNILILAHFPTYFLIVGYFVYWIELYLIRLPFGKTSLLAWLISLFLIGYIFYTQRRILWGELSGFIKDGIKVRRKLGRPFYLAVFFALFMLICSAYALLLPLHLPQEFDCLNYHVSLPRQHLIMHSFKHIHWSAADLFLLPLQSALAPYWLATEIPNKTPQIFFILGLLAVSGNLLHKLYKTGAGYKFILWFAILGSHNIAIQMGTAMLDLAICYLFIAFLDSIFMKRYILAAFEFSFYLFSKPFVPLQMGLVMLILFVILLFAAKNKIICSLSFPYRLRWNASFKETAKKFYVCFLILIFFIAGPFISKSIYYAGTPLYPFFPGIIKPAANNTGHLNPHWEAILEASSLHISTKDGWGAGRSLWEFLRHFWVLAVPEKGVMNRYDYPLGLPYLLFIMPFLVYLGLSLNKKRIPIIPFFVISYWMVWWFGLQQSRFLYIPLLLIYISVIGALPKISRTLILCLCVALFTNNISIFRSHCKDFNKPRINMLRDKDRKLLELNSVYRLSAINSSKAVKLNFFDIAYAEFPVDVVCEKDLCDPRWVLSD